MKNDQLRNGSMRVARWLVVAVVFLSANGSRADYRDGTRPFFTHTIDSNAVDSPLIRQALILKAEGRLHDMAPLNSGAVDPINMLGTCPDPACGESDQWGMRPIRLTIGSVLFRSLSSASVPAALPRVGKFQPLDPH